MIKMARSKFALLAGAVLAVTAGSVAYGAGEAPLSPAPPERPEMREHIVIVERHGDEGGDEFVRTVTKDGKTFVFQTDRALTDGEVSQRVAVAEARLPLAPPEPPAVGGGRRVITQRVIVVDETGEQVTDVVTEDGPCHGREATSDVDTSSETSGNLTRVRVRMCGSEHEISKQAKAEAIAGIDQARSEIARDKDLPAAARSQVLKELDAEMARLKRES